MIIPINLHSRGSSSEAKFPPQLAKLGTDEIILIELQGSFHVEGDRSGHLAARLKLENENKPTLLIGHNLLEGKIVDLSKPLAVLCKRTSANDALQLDDEVESKQRKAEQSVEYDMLAVVKRKVLFSKRPMPIVNVTSPSTDGNVK